MLNESVIEALKAVPTAPEMFTKEVVIETPAELEAFMQVKPAKPVKPAKAKKPAKPKAPKEPRVTKQSKVNAFVKDRVANRTLPITKEFRQVMILEIMALAGMSKAGATTYFYNALKAL